MLRRIIAFVAAVTLMVTLGAVTQSYLVQQAWSVAAGQAAGGAPVAIPLSDRLAWAEHDFAGILLSYGAVMAGTLLVALLVAGAVARYSSYRVIIFGLGSATGVFTIFTLLRRFLGTVGIFGVRGPLGMSTQMIIALLAGIVFAQLTRPRAAKC